MYVMCVLITITLHVARDQLRILVEMQTSQEGSKRPKIIRSDTSQGDSQRPHFYRSDTENELRQSRDGFGPDIMGIIPHDCVDESVSPVKDNTSTKVQLQSQIHVQRTDNSAQKTNGKSSAYYVSETVHDSSNNTDSSDGKPRNAP